MDHNPIAATPGTMDIRKGKTAHPELKQDIFSLNK
jgi:hypothetical protein